ETAAAASGERAPGNRAAMAPAPRRSSIAKRRAPSLHRSPAGMIPKGPPSSTARAPTAEGLRRHPASTCPRLAAIRDMVAPLGDGRTRRKPGGALSNEAGDNE